jgi:hypothetical protein
MIEGKLGQGRASGQSEGFIKAYKDAGLDIGNLGDSVSVKGAGGKDLQVFSGGPAVASEMSFRSFTYAKDSVDKLYHVRVHLFDTHSVARSYPEKTLRRKRWFSREDAGKQVGQVGVRELLYELVQSNAPGPPDRR